MALSGRGTYKLPDILNRKYSHFNDIPRIIPTTTIDNMTPIVGSYTPASPPAIDIWGETKYIVYQQPDPTSSPYLEPTTTSPFFEFTDIGYYDNVCNEDGNGVEYRGC